MSARQIIEAASQCCAHVRGGSVCVRGAVVWREGKPYCYAHDPDRTHLSMPYAKDRRRRVRWTAEAAGKTDAYLSIVLDDASRARVQRLAVHPNVYGDHVTVAYQPTGEQLKQLRPQVGKRFKFEAVAIVQDSKGQALRVTGVPSLNAHPHVTVSCAEGIDPVYSNELLAREQGQPKTVRLAGRLEEGKVDGVEEALKIRVPPFAQSAFFQDHGAPEEFWAMKMRPKTRAGDVIEFYFGSKPVATAKVSRVEEPGQSTCGHSGKFGAKWKVHWKDASFCCVSESDENAPIVGIITWDGDVKFLQTWQSHREARLGRGFAWRYAPSTLMIYWWDGDGRTPDREAAVKDVLEDAGYPVKGHADMLPYGSDEESKNWNAAHATHWRSLAVAESKASAVIESAAPWGVVGYRAYNYNPPREASVADLVAYEANELGNNDILAQAEASAERLGLDLAKIPASDALWVTRTREQAQFYGDDVREHDITGWVPLVDLGDEGGLLLRPRGAGARRVIEAVTGPPSSLYRKPSDPDQEHIVSAAVKSRMTGDIFLGDDHAHAFDVANEAGTGISQNSASLGFWTSRDRFVTRAEALEIARAQKQRGRARFDDNTVHSVELMSPEAEKSLQSRW